MLDYRGWIPGYTRPEFGLLDKRIAMMTGLSMTTAEDLQVAAYTIGGKYDPHFDFARVERFPFFPFLQCSGAVSFLET